MTSRLLMQLFALAVSAQGVLASFDDGAALLQVHAAETDTGVAAQQQWPLGGFGGGMFPFPQTGRVADQTKKSGVTFECSVDGEHARDIDVSVGQSRDCNVKKETGGQSHTSCTIRSGDEASITVSSNFVTPLVEGDTFTFRQQQTFTGLPVPMVFPPVTISCPACGAKCDMSPEKIAPGAAAMVQSMLAMLRSFGMNFPLNMDPARTFTPPLNMDPARNMNFTVPTGPVDMPPCPIVPNATKGVTIDSNMFEKARAQVPPMMAGTLDAMTMTYTGRLTLQHADGSKILDLSTSGTMGKV